MRKFLLIMDIVFLLIVGYQLYAKRTQTKILFIGNSYTYRNEMPDIFEHIAISKGKKVFVQSETKGMATLLVQSERDEVYSAIDQAEWDYVIIQGSSRDFIQPNVYIRDTTLPAMEKLVRAIRRNRADTKILLYMTWGYRNGYVPFEETDTYEKMTLKIRDQYVKIGKQYNFGVVPVGMAFRDSRSRRPEENMYVKDGAHPSLKGSYLAACCFYAAIFNESAVGATYYGKLGPKICYYLQSLGSRNVLYQRNKYGLIGLETN